MSHVVTVKKTTNTEVINAKAGQVSALKEKMAKATSGVIVDYRGITVADDTKLRRDLRAAGVEYSVIKNNIMRRAAEEAGLGEMSAFMKDTSACALSGEDPLAAAKILCKYAEDSKGKFVVKGGFMEGKVLDAEGIVALSKLPGKQELLTMLCMALNGNIRGLAVALNAIVEKNGSAESSEAAAE